MRYKMNGKIRIPLLEYQVGNVEDGASQVVLVVKNPLANAGEVRDVGSIPGSGSSPGRGHDNPLQYACLENPMDREAWRAMIHRVAKSQTGLKQLNTYAWIHPVHHLATRSLGEGIAEAERCQQHFGTQKMDEWVVPTQQARREKIKTILPQNPGKSWESETSGVEVTNNRKTGQK